MGSAMNKKAVIEDDEIEVIEEETEVSEIVEEVEPEDTEEVVVSIGEEAPPPEIENCNGRTVNCKAGCKLHHLRPSQW
jgi:hypothetical protein